MRQTPAGVHPRRPCRTVSPGRPRRRPAKVAVEHGAGDRVASLGARDDRAGHGVLVDDIKRGPH
jgi:hypothetical protein